MTTQVSIFIRLQRSQSIDQKGNNVTIKCFHFYSTSKKPKSSSGQSTPTEEVKVSIFIRLQRSQRLFNEAWDWFPHLLVSIFIRLQRSQRVVYSLSFIGIYWFPFLFDFKEAKVFLGYYVAILDSFHFYSTSKKPKLS